MTLLHYPLDYAPDVVEMHFSQVAMYLDLPNISFAHQVNIADLQQAAQKRVWSMLLWFVVACIVVMLTMYLQKRKYQKY